MILTSEQLVAVSHRFLPYAASEVRRSYRTARREGFTRASARKLARSYADSLIRRYMNRVYPELMGELLPSSRIYPEGGYQA